MTNFVLFLAVNKFEALLAYGKFIVKNKAPHFYGTEFKSNDFARRYTTQDWCGL